MLLEHEATSRNTVIVSDSVRNTVYSDTRGHQILGQISKRENLPVCRMTGIYFNLTSSLLIYTPPTFDRDSPSLHSWWCHWPHNYLLADNKKFKFKFISKLRFAVHSKLTPSNK